MEGAAVRLPDELHYRPSTETAGILHFRGYKQPCSGIPFRPLDRALKGRALRLREVPQAQREGSQEGVTAEEMDEIITAKTEGAAGQGQGQEQ